MMRMIKQKNILNFFLLLYANNKKIFLGGLQMNLNSILQILMLIVITIVGYFLKDLPNLYREMRVEQFKGKKEKDMQKESFFRQIKGSDIDKAFSFWTSLLVDMDNKMANIDSPAGKKELIEMQQRVLMYGSQNTVVILSTMMQHVYKTGEIKNSVKVDFGKQDDTKVQINSYKLMYYVVALISSLKEDFTGYKIDPMDILRIKISDIDSHKNKPLFDEACAAVKKELKSAGIVL